jgi:hypothetical protein
MIGARSYIHYYAEGLGNGRGILRCDVVVDGVLVPELSGEVGSPAPIDTVRQHERTFVLHEVAR